MDSNSNFINNPNHSSNSEGLDKHTGEGEPMDIATEQTAEMQTEQCDITITNQQTQGDNPIGFSDGINTDDEEALLKSPSNMPAREERPKVSGAARKRLSFYLSKGLCRKDAEELSKVPMAEGKKKMAELVASNKRERSPNSTGTPPSNTPKRPAGQADKRAMSEERRVSFADVAKTNAPASKEKANVEGIKLGLIPPDYPQTTWSSEQLKQIQIAMLDRVRQLKHGSEKPIFNSCTFRPGWLSIVCADQITAQWVKHNAPTLKLWEGAVMKVVEERDVPRPHVFVGYFAEPATVSNQGIFDLIEGQNTGLKVRDWRVLRRVHKGPTVELTISMDPISAKMITDNGEMINYGFGKARIHPKPRHVERSDTGAAQQSEEACCSKDAQSKPRNTAPALKPRLIPGYSLKNRELSSTPKSTSNSEAQRQRPHMNPKGTFRQRAERTREEEAMGSGRQKKVAKRTNKEKSRNDHSRK